MDVLITYLECRAEPRGAGCQAPGRALIADDQKPHSFFLHLSDGLSRSFHLPIFGDKVIKEDLVHLEA